MTDSTIEIPLPAEFDAADLTWRQKLLGKARGHLGPSWALVTIDTDRNVAIFAEWQHQLGDEKKVRIGETRAAAIPATVVQLEENYYPGYRVVEFDEARSIVRLRVLDAHEQALRDQVARGLGCRPWEVEIEVDVEDGETVEVRILRMPALKPEQQAKMLEHTARKIVGHSGWHVFMDESTNTARLRRGQPLALPDKTPMRFDLFGYGKRRSGDDPYGGDDYWSWLPFADDGRGGVVGFDMAVNPHGLVVGKTGSGKTILLLALAVGALSNGCELVVVDPTKRGLDFRMLEPWVRPGGWGCKSYEEAYATLKGVYDEALRRVDILDELGVVRWSKLPAEQLAEFGIRPIFVVLDEFTSLAKEVPIPKALEKDDPERLAAEALNIAKARIVNLVGKIARECRFVGVHQVLGTQRFDVANVGNGAGELRENLGSRVLLGKASRTALGMAFLEAEAAVEASAAAHDMTPDEVESAEASGTWSKSKAGRGVAELDGLGTLAFHAWYSPEEEIKAFLEGRVPQRPEHLASRPEVAVEEHLAVPSAVPARRPSSGPRVADAARAADFAAMLVSGGQMRSAGDTEDPDADSGDADGGGGAGVVPPPNVPPPVPPGGVAAIPGIDLSKL